ncbi:MAG: tyrosine recombinase XerC [Litorivicinus sp.]
MNTQRAVADWLSTLEQSQARAPTTLAAYRRDLSSLPDIALTDLDGDAVRRWTHQARSHGLSPTSLARRLSALRSFCQHARRHGWMSHDPCAGIRAPKTDRRLPNTLSVDDAQALLTPSGDTPIDRRDQALWELLYGSGMRLAEVAGLQLSDLDLADRIARVTGKGSKTRMAPLTTAAVSAVEAWLAVRPVNPCNALFNTDQGRPLSMRQIQRRLKQRALATLDHQALHPHQLRHAFATHMLEGSGDLRAVQELLGHAHLSTTQVYTHLDFNHIAQAYDQAHPRARRKP